MEVEVASYYSHHKETEDWRDRSWQHRKKNHFGFYGDLSFPGLLSINMYICFWGNWQNLYNVS